MKLSEIKEQLVNNTIDGLINVKKYISVVDKKELIQSIIDTCLKDSDNGMKYVDYFAKRISFDVALIINYTDIEDLDLEDSYDFLNESGILEYVKETIPYDEFVFIDMAIDEILSEQKELSNSISAVVNTNLAKVVDIVDRRFPTEKEIQRLLKSLTKNMKDLDWSKVPMLQKMRDVAEGKTVI